ncbi:MAG: hypothetical protein NTW21_23465 [Verrucomicrobia bacterium]|nr:hypothetical protein [Verrucomicrobiota bacterium]
MRRRDAGLAEAFKGGGKLPPPSPSNYSDDWIEKRMRSIAIRDELTGEWNKRGVKEQRDYAILTAEISKAAFGLTPAEYTKLKGLKRENLRDHMTDPERRSSATGGHGGMIAPLCWRNKQRIPKFQGR